jgi:hypothetical protein
MKTYKVWVEIEEVDDNSSTYVDVSNFPVCLGEFTSLEDADAAIIELTGQSTL